MFEDPRSKISQLEKILDAREDRVTGKTRRHDLHNREYVVNQDWDNKEFEVGSEIKEPAPMLNTMESSQKVKESQSMSFSVKILIGSIIFFIFAAALVGYKFLGGGNLVSGSNIDVTVKAPISISGGGLLPFEIEIKNNNNLTLLGADLGVTFPAGAKDANDTSQSAKRVQQYIGDILPGQSIKRNLSVVLFGQENEKKDITINLEYKVSGSNSLFNKTKTITILISSSPVNITVSGPSEVNTNQSVDFTVEVTSNSPLLIKNLLVKVDYPFGFDFVSSNPKTFSKNNLWLIGDLSPGAKRVIKFSGVLNGQEGEERGFNFNTGAQSKSDTLAIEVPFSSAVSTVTIRRPFVSADIFINGSAANEYVSSAGSKLEVVIRWKNNLAYEVSDVSIIANISGNTIDKASVNVSNGFYRSINNTITFNKTTDSGLASLEPGKEGESKFSFSSFGVGTVTGSGLSNPTISLDFSVKGHRVDFAVGQEDVLFSESRKIKITSNPQLFAKALYFVGPFQNSGPIPPKAEQETMYTITWTVTNPLNNVSGARVSTVLPPYVKWLGQINPANEQVDYDESTGAVVWNVGSVSAGAGTVSPAREVSFQISFLPSVDQIGKTPDLTSEASLTAKDNFTLTPVSDSFTILNTRLTNDPYFKVNNDTVTQ